MRHEGRRIEVSGIVQGVGFRPWVYRIAQSCGVAGQVANGSAGVTIDVFGETEQIERFLDGLHHDPPAASRIETMTARPLPFRGVDAFTIAPSLDERERRISIPPDLATCPECLAETFDPGNRRHRYPFTNCTNCGPRYSIVRDVPYDRPKTTMERFALCDDCRAEYESPSDRRFHAEPNACPVCGPRLSARSSKGTLLGTNDPLGVAVRTILAQMIVALQGIGGFQLVCDATSELAVNRLRERKRRPAKPFAVMVADLAMAEEIAEIDEEERRLLTSVERPIVLLRAKPEHALASAIAPRSSIVGLMLPCSPLHHLLMRAAGRPLVMTSGNRSDEPMAHRVDTALAALGGIADVFLTHDREIAARVDDSVARVIAGKPVLLRRARGYVPRPIALRRPVVRPLLACGAHLKNTFCLASDDRAVVGPHIGDLETIDTIQEYANAIDRMKAMLGWSPEVVAYDLHPDAASTRYALMQRDVTAIGVQHHHAHIASVMAEHQLEGAVFGVAWDGTGHGTDGAAWGGEFMIATAARFDRVATFRPIALAGGDVAVREIWRLALAMLIDAFGEVPDAPLLRRIDAKARAVVTQMLAARIHTPPAHGVGRWFDAFSALFLDRAEATYEGEAALAWNEVADPEERGRYPFVIDRSTEPWQIDPRAMVRAAWADFREGTSPAIISARFHNTLAQIVVDAADIFGPDLPIVLGGGCFQSSLLTAKIAARLGPNRDVFFNQQVPPGDGGIALGQAFVADAVMRAQSTGGL